MARKFIRAGERAGDRTFKLGQPLPSSKKAPSASSRGPRTPNGKLAPGVAPQPRSKPSVPSSAPRNGMSPPRAKPMSVNYSPTPAPARRRNTPSTPNTKAPAAPSYTPLAPTTGFVNRSSGGSAYRTGGKGMGMRAPNHSNTLQNTQQQKKIRRQMRENKQVR